MLRENGEKQNEIDTNKYDIQEIIKKKEWGQSFCVFDIFSFFNLSS